MVVMTSAAAVVASVVTIFDNVVQIHSLEEIENTFMLFLDRFYRKWTYWISTRCIIQFMLRDHFLLNLDFLVLYFVIELITHYVFVIFFCHHIICFCESCKGNTFV